MLRDLSRPHSFFGARPQPTSPPFVSGVQTPGDETTLDLGVHSIYQYTNVATGAASFFIRAVHIAAASPGQPWVFTVKDVGGAAAANPLTISTEGAVLIDGAATVILNTNYGSFTFFCDGSNLFVIASN